MSPVKVKHTFFQGEIEFLLRSLKGNGKVGPECAIWTKKGTKVADVVWCSKERWEIIKEETEASIAPEICIEVLSASNTEEEHFPEELQEKRELYFEQEAQEVWFCDEEGVMSFYTPQGPLDNSEIVKDFPEKIEL